MVICGQRPEWRFENHQRNRERAGMDVQSPGGKFDFEPEHDCVLSLFFQPNEFSLYESIAC